MSENWKVVSSFPNYEVSNLGRVRNRFSTLVLSPVLNGGYLRVTLYGPGRETVKIHNLVADAFLGARPADAEVCHCNGNPQDNSVTNLRYDSRSENQKDSVSHGTHVQSRKTECPEGHQYDYVNPKTGARGCKKCRYESTKKARRK